MIDIRYLAVGVYTREVSAGRTWAGRRRDGDVDGWDGMDDYVVDLSLSSLSPARHSSVT